MQDFLLCIRTKNTQKMVFIERSRLQVGIFIRKMVSKNGSIVSLKKFLIRNLSFKKLKFLYSKSMEKTCFIHFLIRRNKNVLGLHSFYNRAYSTIFLVDTEEIRIRFRFTSFVLFTYKYILEQKN